MSMFYVNFFSVRCVCTCWVAVAVLNPHRPSESCPLHTSLPAVSPCQLPPPLSSPLLPPPASCPLLSSYVDEIRWFLLGEASVHPSAAPSRARPTPSNQVINKPANSLSLSLSIHNPLPLFHFSCSLCASLSIRSTLWTHWKPTHWHAHFTFPLISKKKKKIGLSPNVRTEVTYCYEGHSSILKEWWKKHFSDLRLGKKC